MNTIWKAMAKIVLGFVVIAALFWLAYMVGNQIFKARYFKNLDDFEFLIVEETTVCPLHKQAPSNFPILVNTNEGSASELRLYETSDMDPLQIRENDEYGCAWMVGGKGWSGLALPDDHYIHFSIQRDRMFNYSSKAARLFFCDDCTKALRDLNPSCNFVLVDAYEQDDLKFYDMKDIEDAEIRHYSFVIEDKGYDHFSLEMHSSYFNSSMAPILF